jgi:peptidyl-prolyl cis-trans isomerase D
MLRGIQKASSGWLGKAVMAVVMGLIAVSFAIWGIGDIFRGFGRSTLATIGSTEIGIEQFRYYYTDKISQLGRQFNRSITPDQARSLGLDRQIIGELVAETVLDEKARQLKLGVSNEEISRRITSDPTFQGLNGSFDRSRFEQIIRQAGYTEPRFVQEQRQTSLRRQVALSLTGGLKAPTTAQNALNIFQNEKRAADVVALGAAQAGNIAEPTPEALGKYFEERKAAFRAPETRKVSVLTLTPDEQARWATISDDDAKAYYEQRKSDFGTAEKRHLRQIIFANADEANAAAEKIKSGTTFEDLVKARELKESDVDLGIVTKANVIDPTVADAAFALKEGEVSAPIAGQFGTVLIEAVKVESGQHQSFEQASPAIKRTLATAKARSEINALRDKVEDDRAAGSTLAETAAKLKLNSRTIEAVDRSGRDAAGNPIGDLPRNVELINAVFNTDVGVDSEALQVPGGGFVWYDVVAINRSRERTLDEVKAQVEARWKNDEIAARLKAKADDMLGKLKAGTPLADAAAENKLTVQKIADIQRRQAKPPFSAAGVDTVFATAKGQSNTTEGDNPATRLVFIVTDVSEPKLDPAAPQSGQIAERLTRGYSDDLLAEYVGRLETDLGVRINQQALQQIVGGGTGQN